MSSFYDSRIVVLNNIRNLIVLYGIRRLIHTIQYVDFNFYTSERNNYVIIGFSSPTETTEWYFTSLLRFCILNIQTFLLHTVEQTFQ
jgi:hypothetical protein